MQMETFAAIPVRTSRMSSITAGTGAAVLMDLDDALLARGTGPAGDSVLSALEELLICGFDLCIVSDNAQFSVFERVTDPLWSHLSGRGRCDLMSGVEVYADCSTSRTYFGRRGSLHVDAAYGAKHALEKSAAVRVRSVLEAVAVELRSLELDTPVVTARGAGVLCLRPVHGMVRRLCARRIVQDLGIAAGGELVVKCAGSSTIEVSRGVTKADAVSYYLSTHSLIASAALYFGNDFAGNDGPVLSLDDLFAVDVGTRRPSPVRARLLHGGTGPAAVLGHLQDLAARCKRRWKHCAAGELSLELVIREKVLALSGQAGRQHDLLAASCPASTRKAS
jgi:hypothetical protein